MNQTGQSSTRTHRPRWVRRAGWAAVLLVVCGIAYWYFSGNESVRVVTMSVPVKRGDLEITVLEGGSIQAENSLEIKSEVQGETKILKIVEEGYFITPEDVANKMVLVELDSKKLQDDQVQQELQYQNAVASFTEARESYAIAENRNESELKQAELNVKFARLDFERYMGEQAAREIIAQLDISIESLAHPEVHAAGEQEPEQPAAISSPGGADIQQDMVRIGAESTTIVPSLEVDFSKYASPERLGDGAARQELRKLENAVALAGEEVGQAQTQLEGTRRLYERSFVTKIDLDNDEIRLTRGTIGREAAETSKDLFIKYEFPKEAEKLLSAYEESLRRLERARRTAVSELAQASARLKAAEAQFKLQERRRNEIQTQLEKCVIHATQPGLVVYGSSNRDYYRDNDRIEEGATVRERQVIITIPDTTQMVIKVGVHESLVKQVQRGQKARIRVEALADTVLTGEVIKIAVLPDSQNRWLNPDLKVYSTLVRIEGTHEWLRPGMSAEAEILVDTRKDVLYVPIQAVSAEGKEQVVYVDGARGAERRVVATGPYTESFIEIQNGLSEGERVLLRVPEVPSKKGDGENKVREPGEKGERGQDRREQAVAA